MIFGGFFFLIAIVLIFFLIILPFCQSIMHFRKFKQGDHKAHLDHILDDGLEILTKDSNLVNSFEAQPKEKIKYAEVLMMGIAPIMGIGLVYGFESEIKPFELTHFPSLMVYLLLTYFSYWISKYFREEFPVEVNLFLNFGLLTGCIVYPFLAVHYISETTLLGAAIFPFLAFPLFAPIPALLYTLKQSYIHQRFIELQIQETEVSPLNIQSLTVIRELTQFNTPAPWLGLAVFLLVIQSLLGFIGQPFDAIIQAFLNGEEFFFSLNHSRIF